MEMLFRSVCQFDVYGEDFILEMIGCLFVSIVLTILEFCVEYGESWI